MKETHIHGGVTKHPDIAAVGIRQDRLGPVFRADAAQTSNDLVVGFFPGNAPEDPVAVRALWRRPPHGMENPVRRIYTVKVFRNFRAQKTASDGMLGIALDLGRASILHRDEHGASVGAIVWTGGVDHLFHDKKPNE